MSDILYILITNQSFVKHEKVSKHLKTKDCV